jgi:UDP-N-acetylmuramoylalanine--D-glutamate ligase
VAISGTNGKTTVTEATSAMLVASGLQAAAVGNIGVPLSEYADEVYDALVVEVSSFQLRFVDTFHPTAAALTNVAADHLDWHGSVHSYRSAKAALFANQDRDDFLVYDFDDPGATALVATARSVTYPVSGLNAPPGGGGPEGGELRVMGLVIEIGKLFSDNPAHLSNIAAAAALALRVGADPHGVASVAESFRPGAHRRQIVAERDGVTWVDDSKATNPHAALASIRSFDSVVLIAGGLSKGLDVTPLAREPNVRMVLGIGEAGPQLVEAAGPQGRLAESLETAVEIARQVAEEGDTVLLAPGCASFDQFESYRARGDRFTELAREGSGGSGG